MAVTSPANPAGPQGGARGLPGLVSGRMGMRARVMTRGTRLTGLALISGGADARG
jgi:hypothetical protein